MGFLLVVSKYLRLSLCFSFLSVKKFLSLSEFRVVFLSFLVYPFINFLMLRSDLFIGNLLSFVIVPFLFVEFGIRVILLVFAFYWWIAGFEFCFLRFCIRGLLCSLWGQMMFILLDRDEVLVDVLLYWFAILSSIVGFSFILYFYLPDLLIISWKRTILRFRSNCVLSGFPCFPFLLLS